jgi:predicted ATP-dependent serine protease
MSQRLRETGKLGFSRAVMPSGGELEKGLEALRLQRLAHVKMLTQTVMAEQDQDI